MRAAGSPHKRSPAWRSGSARRAWCVRPPSIGRGTRRAGANWRSGRSPKPRLASRSAGWARSASADESTHLAVAAVCGGQLARAYPQIALTRLRHLAVRQNATIRESVFEGLAGLIQEQTLRRSVLSEVADWVSGQEPRRSAGLRAFLRLARLEENGGVVILSETGARDWDLLAGLWREALRDETPDGAAAAAGTVASGWLEAAVRNQAPRESVLEVLARTCRSSIDLAVIADFAYSRADTSENVTSRREIAAELVRRAWNRYLMTTGQRQPEAGPA